MSSAKNKFFNNGTYETVLAAKLDHPLNEHGHQPYGKDSYLSTNQMDVTGGADPEEDQEILYQERISAISEDQTSEDPLEVLHATHTQDTPTNDGQWSDKSSVASDDEDDQN
jgi:hypothetical protein